MENQYFLQYIGTANYATVGEFIDGSKDLKMTYAEEITTVVT